MQMFDRATSGRLINSQCKSDAFTFSKLINTVSTLYYTFIEFIIFLYTFQQILLINANNILFEGFAMELIF